MGNGIAMAKNQSQIIVAKIIGILNVAVTVESIKRIVFVASFCTYRLHSFETSPQNSIIPKTP